MCYHNSLNTKPGELTRRFGLKKGSCPEFSPIGHASGFTYPEWPILTTQQPESFLLGNWGLVPDWAQDPTKAAQLRSVTLNARLETLAEKPSFRGAFKASQRCIIPSTGFFEWQKVGKKKIPYFIRMKNKKVFSMAGIWDTWLDQSTGEQLLTYTIITVPANPLMAKIHNQKQRMPAILDPNVEIMWLNPSFSDSELDTALSPISDSFLTAYPILSPLNQEGADFETLTQRREYPGLNQQQSLF